nr:hypothetical protein [Lachnospiraceae bacterium]
WEEGVTGTKGEGMGSMQEEGVAGAKGEGMGRAVKESETLHTKSAKIQAQSMQWESEAGRGKHDHFSENSSVAANNRMEAKVQETSLKEAVSQQVTASGQTKHETGILAQSLPKPKAGTLPPGKLESRLFSCLPAMYPFEHQEFERSVRMEPQDIGLLPRGMWKYAGNSFLLHSYYAYHHILFVRKVRMEQRNCYLMLPGVYNPKEQHMAQLFGFSRFCPVRKKALQQGDFGYWYMEVEFPLSTENSPLPEKVPQEFPMETEKME